MTNDRAPIQHLAAVLAVLSDDWTDQADMLVALGAAADDDVARRKLQRSLAALQTLGFLIERTPGHHRPAWRLAGHARWRAETYTHADLPLPPLTAREQEVVDLHERAGLSFAEIARRLGIASQNAEGAYQRARRKHGHAEQP